jgi:Dullard-like phosphatase family protein
MTNTIEIANFYEYTKNCMRIIIELKENKSKASIPNKVKILNPDNHKKLAVFDLDETLIHGVVNITNYKNEKNIISITLPSKKIAKIGVNIRPNWEEAIKRIKKLYTIVIYTASHSSYADAVLNFLDPENKYFYNRLYRSNCIDIKLNGKNFYIKDMNIFEDFAPKDILIVDNSVMAFAYDLDNGIPILPYYDAEKDLELLFVAYYFESIYECDDLRVINKEYMKLDYYLNQAIEEYNNESDEESEDSIIDDVQKKEKQANDENINDKIKGVSMKNLLYIKKHRNIKKDKRRPSHFVEQFELDIIKLRTKFSRDEEKKKEQ